MICAIRAPGDRMTERLVPPLRTTVIDDLIRVLQPHRIPVPKRLALSHQPPAYPAATSGIRIFPSPNADFMHTVIIYSMLGSR